jgi:hypothetical protein
VIRAVQSGRITYGAYGDPESGKPLLLGSAERNSTSDWTNIGGYIWRTAVPRVVGNIIFDGGTACGWLKTEAGDLEEQGYFFDNTGTDGTVWLYSTSNPALVYSDIEFALGGNIINGNSYNNIQNLDVRYGGSHGIHFSGGPHDNTVSGCDISLSILSTTPV